MNRIVDIGLDIGSTTVKVVLMDHETIVYKNYLRHHSDVRRTVTETLRNLAPRIRGCQVRMQITGSGGFEIAHALDVSFVQEVIASAEAVERYIPDTDVAIELGGEDAKITYFGESVEQRMNGTCAGGTGAFIDQMASLLKTNAEGLNEMAKDYVTIYPIASRCGVFAKTDIQPLINEGAAKSDIAVSVLQAIVNQTIGGLAQGRSIRGNVAFLGGPLTFLSELRKRFIETLKLKEDSVRFPDDAEYFVAIGAALIAKECKTISAEQLIRRLDAVGLERQAETLTDSALFETDEEYRSFRERHAAHRVGRAELTDHAGPVYLGIDAGSTTTKLVLIDTGGRVLHSHYSSNLGQPLQSTIAALRELESKMGDRAVIAKACVTGYGEQLIKAALKADLGEIETIAHYRAAAFFQPDVDFILDIGGQDMKSLKIRKGTVHSIMLNEACSSGCGSFIETFADSLGMDIGTFTASAVQSRRPVDLGTRCTVFMNSKVKQAQKEGAAVEDIAAGIAMSVVKNALFKVIRMKSSEELGSKVVVQGGTFYNDAVLRSIERLTGLEVIRPDIAGVMGAFGAALIAKEQSAADDRSGLIWGEELDHFTVSNRFARCGRCANNCQLTISQFSDGRRFITGNRCERGGLTEEKSQSLPNLFDYKYNRVFDYTPLDEKDAPRGVIGIPRVLNIYEDYPFWHAALTSLGYRVQLSGRSSKQVFERGMESIPSESVCYPAKLVHGHIETLIDEGIHKIFYPAIPYNRLEDPDAGNHFNCPIVTSYSETIHANVESLKAPDIQYMNPFLPIDDSARMVKRFHHAFRLEGVTLAEAKRAVEEGYRTLEAYRLDLKEEGERVLGIIRQRGLKAIVLAGRPYHVDPEIHHGLPELITGMGYPVLSEDAVAHLGTIERPLRVIDQWVYHSRLYRAAHFVATRTDLELVQLNSFGCGLDAVTIDQVQEILERHNKIHTVIKIDEINNLGAARIRLRSLFASMREREQNGVLPEVLYPVHPRKVFTQEMKELYTILAPQMSPIHFELLEEAFYQSGYRVEILGRANQGAIDAGLKYVNNDACYPAIIVIGQLMQALESGRYDLDKTAVLISQTGGGCRATNYIAFLRKALKDAGMEQVPVISLSASGLEQNPGFKVNLPLVRRAVRAVVYGDLLMRVLHRVRPYEKFENSANQLYRSWVERLRSGLALENQQTFHRNIRRIVRDFDQLEIQEHLIKPRVGIVGEILVKYHPDANNDIVAVLEKEGAEVIVPDLLDFFLYSFHNSAFKYHTLSGSYQGWLKSRVAIGWLEQYRKVMRDALRKSRRFHSPKTIGEIAAGAGRHLSLGNQTGEGWFLTGEMVELIEEGIPNVFCVQPFGCLPNHIVGKGMIKKLRDANPHSNIVAIDYDAGASEVNQLNRIKLMLSMAFKNLQQGRNNQDLADPQLVDGIQAK